MNSNKLAKRVKLTGPAETIRSKLKASLLTFALTAQDR
jgi:hypothetical protein